MLVRRLDAKGEPCFGHGTSDFVTGADAVVVLVTLALRLTLGQWFLDTSLGVAWWTDDENADAILGRMPANIAFARSEILRVISTTQGVAKVIDLQVAFDHRSRTSAIDADILTDFGGPRKIQVRAT